MGAALAAACAAFAAAMADKTRSTGGCAPAPAVADVAGTRDVAGIAPPEMDTVERPASWLAVRWAAGATTGGLEPADGGPEGDPPFAAGGLLRLPARLNLQSVTQCALSLSCI